PSVPSPGRVVVLGIAWALFGWVPLFWPGLSWQAYYTLFGSLGVWLALARFLARRRSLATALIFGIALLRGARAGPPAREWGDEPAGPDYFFRYDSLASWIEVVRGPEDVRRARAIDPRWEQDHARLADVLALGDDWERAADEYRKLAREAPDHPDYAHNVAVCL